MDTRATACLIVDKLQRNLKVPLQLEAALEASNVDTARSCPRNWNMQAASEQHVDVCKLPDDIFRRKKKRGIRRPMWFNELCLQKRLKFIQAVQSGLAVHACMHLHKETNQARRACSC